MAYPNLDMIMEKYESDDDDNNNTNHTNESEITTNLKSDNDVHSSTIIKEENDQNIMTESSWFGESFFILSRKIINQMIDAFMSVEPFHK